MELPSPVMQPRAALEGIRRGVISDDVPDAAAAGESGAAQGRCRRGRQAANTERTGRRGLTAPDTALVGGANEWKKKGSFFRGTPFRASATESSGHRANGRISRCDAVVPRRGLASTADVLKMDARFFQPLSTQIVPKRPRTRKPGPDDMMCVVRSIAARGKPPQRRSKVGEVSRRASRRI